MDQVMREINACHNHKNINISYSNILKCEHILLWLSLFSTDMFELLFQCTYYFMCESKGLLILWILNQFLKRFQRRTLGCTCVLKHTHDTHPCHRPRATILQLLVVEVVPHLCLQGNFGTLSYFPKSCISKHSQSVIWFSQHPMPGSSSTCTNILYAFIAGFSIPPKFEKKKKFLILFVYWLSTQNMPNTDIHNFLIIHTANYYMRYKLIWH